MKTRVEITSFLFYMYSKVKKNTSFEARAVIDASATWQNGNPLRPGGLLALGEIADPKQSKFAK